MTSPRADAVAVLGGGMMGLGVSLRLAQAGIPVTLYEAGPRPGGVSASFRLGDCVVDRFYHTILPGDTALLDLIGEVGLADRVSWRTTRTGFYQAGRHHSVSSLLEFLRFGVLTPGERLRLGWTLFRAQRYIDAASIRHLTCEEWLTRTCGRSVYRKLWDPLLRAKLGEAAPRVSASFIWATMNRLQDAKRGDEVGRKDRMGFLVGGYDVLLEQIIKHLQAGGVQIRTSAPVTRIEADSAGWWVEAGGSRERYGDVVAALPLPAVRALLGPEATGHRIAETLPTVEYLGVVIDVLLLERPLGPFYILNLGDPDLTLTGVIEMTNLAPPGYFRGRSVVYLPRYVLPGDALWSRSDEEVGIAFRRDLSRIYPEFRPEHVVASAVQRARLVQPIHTVDYRSPAENPAPNFWIASSAQVHPWPLANDKILRQAARVVGGILAQRKVSPSTTIQPAGSRR